MEHVRGCFFVCLPIEQARNNCRRNITEAACQELSHYKHSVEVDINGIADLDNEAETGEANNAQFGIRKRAMANYIVRPDL